MLSKRTRIELSPSHPLQPDLAESAPKRQRTDEKSLTDLKALENGLLKTTLTEINAEDTGTCS